MRPTAWICIHILFNMLHYIERLSESYTQCNIIIEPEVKEKYLGLRNHYDFIQELIKVEVNKQL